MYALEKHESMRAPNRNDNQNAHAALFEDSVHNTLRPYINGSLLKEKEGLWKALPVIVL
jgi:hypothetical protein